MSIYNLKDKYFKKFIKSNIKINKTSKYHIEDNFKLKKIIYTPLIDNPKFKIGDRVSTYINNKIGYIIGYHKNLIDRYLVEYTNGKSKIVEGKYLYKIIY